MRWRAERLLAEQQLLSSSLTAQLEFATRAEAAGAQFTCFAGTKVQILTVQLEFATRGRGGRCSVYLLCWYKRTDTDYLPG
jgi:hypothetical protein